MRADVIRVERYALGRRGHANMTDGITGGSVTETAADRHGAPWTAAEMAQLLDGIGAGRTVKELAAAHQRTPGAIYARASLLLDVVVATRAQALDVLRERLADPSFDRQDAVDRAGAKKAPSHHGTGTRANPSTHAGSEDDAPSKRSANSPASKRKATSPQRLIDLWQELAGTVLSPQQVQAFVDHDATALLSGYGRYTLIVTARRLLETEGRLRLQRWLELSSRFTLDEYLPVVADGLTGEGLREALAASIDDLDDPRHRHVLARRLDLDGHGFTTLEQIGETLRVTGERARQVQENALRHVARQGRDDTRPAARLRALLRMGDDVTDLRERMLTVAGDLDFDAAASTALTLVARLGGVSAGRARHVAAEVATVLRLREQELARSIATQAAATARIERWLNQVEWPTSLAPEPPIAEFPALRSRLVDGDGHGGTWWSEKLQRDVAYDSTLELRVIKVLDACPLIAWYQEQPFALPYTVDGRGHTYYPDLVVALADGRVVLVEIKPLPEMALLVSQAKFAAARRFAHDRGWGWIATDGARTMADLAAVPVDDGVRQALSRELDRSRTLSWPDVVRLRLSVPGLTHRALGALVLREGWEWRRAPYRLSRRGLSSFIDDDMNGSTVGRPGFRDRDMTDRPAKADVTPQ